MNSGKGSFPRSLRYHIGMLHDPDTARPYVLFIYVLSATIKMRSQENQSDFRKSGKSEKMGPPNFRQFREQNSDRANGEVREEAGADLHLPCLLILCPFDAGSRNMQSARRPCASGWSLDNGGRVRLPFCGV